MKRLLKRMAPSFALDVFHMFTRPRAKAYATWEEASKASLQSYDSQKLARLVKYKTEAMRQTPAAYGVLVGDLALLAAIARLLSNRRSLKVIDFGGACGAHFFLAKAIYPDVSFEWRVVETEVMVSEARSLQTAELSFFSRLDAASGGFEPDLVHTSGTLQCLSNPYITLQQLVDIGAKSLLLNRLGMSETDAPVFTVHRHNMSLNGRGPVPLDFIDEICSCPFQFPSRVQIEAMFSKRYKLMLKAEDQSGLFEVRGARLQGTCYVCDQLV